MGWDIFGWGAGHKAWSKRHRVGVSGHQASLGAVYLGWDNERSLYLRHEGHEMKLKFMTPRQAKKDPHTLKEKIKKEEI